LHAHLFQDKLYRHLIAWKWAHGITEPGKFLKTNKAGEVVEYRYDAILPKSFADAQCWPNLYPAIVEKLREHRKLNKFHIHNHFYHMASSQAANLNLFLPLLINQNAAAVLRVLRPDFASLATDALDHGYCVEYWGGNLASHGGKLKHASPLRDKTGRTGTDADIAIAYRNHTGELCLWLVEHKLTEQEFTACGGAKSKGAPITTAAPAASLTYWPTNTAATTTMSTSTPTGRSPRRTASSSSATPRTPAVPNLRQPSKSVDPAPKMTAEERAAYHTNWN
jgi:hypothetical protein